MKFATLLTAIAAGITVTNAQTPPGFNVSTSTSMTVLVQPANISVTAGLLVAKSGTSSQPILKIPSSLISSPGPFVAIMIDNDVPLLHWLQPNLYANGTQLVFNATGPNAGPAIGASYIAPSPPAGSSHTYVITLFNQPSVWQIPLYYSQLNPPPNTASRMGIDIGNFASAANLGQPIAANYFRVANGTTGESTAVGSSTMSGMTSMTSMTSASAMTTGTGTRPSSVATSTGTNTASASASASASSAAAPGQIAEGMTHMLSGVILAGLSLVAMW